jgi:hypothetical protein
MDHTTFSVRHEAHTSWIEGMATAIPVFVYVGRADPVVTDCAPRHDRRLRFASKVNESNASSIAIATGPDRMLQGIVQDVRARAR